MASFKGQAAFSVDGKGRVAIPAKMRNVLSPAAKGTFTMTRGLAAELAADNIRVNAVNPLAAETGFMKRALGVEKLPPSAVVEWSLLVDPT